jgi:Leucine carboxyl methyltransferase
VPTFSIGLSRLAGGRGKEIVAKLPKWFLGAWTVALHTVIIDDFIATALQDGVDTVLNLGAGLDTRPYRMPLRRTCNGSKSIIRMSSHGNSRLSGPICRLCVHTTARDRLSRVVEWRGRS